MAMSLNSAVRYIVNHVRKKLNAGSYLTADTAIGGTSLTLQDATLFLPAGGNAMIRDRLITYTATTVGTGALTGIPAAGAGSIDAIYTSFVDMVALHQIFTDQEIQEALYLFRRYLVMALANDPVKKEYHYARGGFWQTDYQIRTSNTSTFTALTPDTANYQYGQFTFTTARTEATLYIAGWRHYPDLALAHLWEHLANDDRRFSYYQSSQHTATKRDMFDFAEQYRNLGTKNQFMEKSA
jgi:hypothetical protein